MLEVAPLWAVLPVRSFGAAKTRMAPLLDAPERQRLARLMFADVLAAALKSRSLAGVMVVAADDEVAAAANAHGAMVLKEIVEAGTNAAVRLAVRVLSEAPGSGMIVLPSDIPQVTPVVLDEVALCCAAGDSVVLVPATRDGGTNLLACSRADLIPTNFGPGSFARHQANAARAGITAQISVRGGLDLDLDRPDDLRAFLSRGHGTLTHRWLLASGIAARLEHSPPLARLNGGVWRLLKADPW